MPVDRPQHVRFLRPRQAQRHLHPRVLRVMCRSQPKGIGLASRASR
jgi:hypothetical protein